MKKFILLTATFILSTAASHAEAAPPAAAAETTTEAAAPASTPSASTIEVKDVYAFATAPAQTSGAIFFTIVNGGTTPDKLTGANVGDIATAAELHTNMLEENTVTMIKVDGYDIGAGQTLALEPTGHHIMLTGLKAPLTVGQTFPITLQFASKGEVATEVSVRSPVEQIDHSVHVHESEGNATGLDTSNVPAATHEGDHH